MQGSISCPDASDIKIHWNGSGLIYVTYPNDGRPSAVVWNDPDISNGTYQVAPGNPSSGTWLVGATGDLNNADTYAICA